MSCKLTLTAEEFKTVHNALCAMRSIQNSIDGVVHENIMHRLTKAITNMEQGLEGAYEQENNEVERKLDHYTELQHALGLKSIWSVLEVEDLYTRHPHAGATKIKYRDQYTHIRTDAGSIHEWIDLYIAADQAIKVSGDQHHIYIEAFTPIAEEPGVLRLTCGS